MVRACIRTIFLSQFINDFFRIKGVDVLLGEQDTSLSSMAGRTHLNFNALYMDTFAIFAPYSQDMVSHI